MNSPIKAGDLAEVINGMLGKASPNIGLIVKVKAFRGEHTQYGRIWRCEAHYAELGQPGGKLDSDGKLIPGKGIVTGEADFAQDWLRKIDPPEQSSTTNTNQTLEEKV